MIFMKMGKKVNLFHREIEVKVLLEVFAVYGVLALVLVGAYYLEPKITGFAIGVNDYSSKVDPEINDSGGIIKTMLSLTFIVIVSLLVYNLILKGKMPVGVTEEIEESRKKEKKANIEIQKKRKDKSRLFVKCHNLLLKTDKALQNKDIFGANMLYIKTREAYMKLEYMEKKEVYGEFMQLYNKLRKGRK